MCLLSRFSHVRLFVTLWTVAHQASLSMGFSRQAYWSGLPYPPPGDLPHPGIEPESLMSSALADGFFTTSAIWEALPFIIRFLKIIVFIWLCWGSVAARAFSGCSKQGPPSNCGVRASHCSSFCYFRVQAFVCSGFSLCGSRVLEQRLSNCGSWA